jgi:predicted DNA-binding protein (MmcQ/YjbR family)
MKASFDRPLFARARRFCLALPEVQETLSWGHPNFRVRNRTFCAFELIGGRPSIAFRLPPADVEKALRREGFFATPYGRGRWASLWLDGAVNWREVQPLIERSYRELAGKRLEALLPKRRNSRVEA